MAASQPPPHAPLTEGPQRGTASASSLSGPLLSFLGSSYLLPTPCFFPCSICSGSLVTNMTNHGRQGRSKNRILGSSQNQGKQELARLREEENPDASGDPQTKITAGLRSNRSAPGEDQDS